jgi:hypothetical protein
MTAIAIKNRADTLTTHGKMDADAGKARGFLVDERGRILVNTDADFATEAEAEAHMKEVVAACVEWGNAGMPRIG